MTKPRYVVAEGGIVERKYITPLGVPTHEDTPVLPKGKFKLSEMAAICLLMNRAHRRGVERAQYQMRLALGLVN